MSETRMIVLDNKFADVRKAASGPQLMKALMAGGEVVRNYARLNIRDQDLIDTSNMVNSIAVEPSTSSGTEAEVNIGTSVVYAAIHEFGGVIKAKKAKMLSWVNDAGERVFAKMVHIPARPYLRPAVDEHMDEIGEAVGNNLVEQIGKVL